MKKSGILITSILTLSLMLAACGSTGTQSSSQSSSQSSTQSSEKSTSEDTKTTAAGSSSEEKTSAQTSSSSESTSTSESSASAYTYNEDEANIATVTEAEKTEISPEITAAFQSLFEKAIECAKNEDRTGFEQLFYQPEEEKSASAIESYYTYFKDSYVPNAYPNYGYSILWGDGTYYIGFVMNSTCEGEYPDTTYKSSCGYMYMSNKGGDYLFDCTEEASDVFSGYDATAAMYPSDMLEAALAGRNAANFCDNDYSWINEALVIPGTVESKLYLAWQLEDGSVRCLINVKNGLDQDVTITNEYFKLADDELGQITVGQSGELGTLKAGEAKNYILRIAAEDIETGTEIWESPTVQVIDTVDTE